MFQYHCREAGFLLDVAGESKIVLARCPSFARYAEFVLVARTTSAANTHGELGIRRSDPP